MNNNGQAELNGLNGNGTHDQYEGSGFSQEEIPEATPTNRVQTFDEEESPIEDAASVIEQQPADVEEEIVFNEIMMTASSSGIANRPPKGAVAPKYIGIDLGTTSIMSRAIYPAVTGKNLQEQSVGEIPDYPSIVAVKKWRTREKGGAGEPDEIVEHQDPFLYGAEAFALIGRTVEGEGLVWPFEEGILLGEKEVGKKLILHAIAKLLSYQPTSLSGTEIVFGIPAGKQTGNYVKILREIGKMYKMKVHICYQQVLAALGAPGVDLNGHGGNLVGDIGGGTTDISLMRGHRILRTCSIPVGGRKVDAAIKRHMSLRRQMTISLQQAEEIKKMASLIKCPVDLPYSESQDYSDRDTYGDICISVTGLKKGTTSTFTLLISAMEIDFATAPVRAEIIAGFHQILEDAAMDGNGGLMDDVANRGVILCGGTANLRGLAELFSINNLGKVRKAKNPEQCLIRGMKRAMEDPRLLGWASVKEEAAPKKHWWKFGH
jgi:rod shape-determining protein MreB